MMGGNVTAPLIFIPAGSGILSVNSEVDLVLLEQEIYD